jgi:2-polyprenyl-3-methyl-5-hydroxy-6-metoxy-1,4-benzoquinol methylase
MEPPPTLHFLSIVQLARGVALCYRNLMTVGEKTLTWLGYEMAAGTQNEAPDIETSSEDYARRFAGPVGDFFLRVQERICLELLRPWAGCRVLDVGGGHGQIAVPLAAAGYDVTVLGSAVCCGERVSALEASPSLKIRFVTGELLNLPFPDGSYDVVVSLRLISHVPQWRRLIRELTRVARRAVLIDYPSLMSFNLAVPLLFRMKKMVERNTRRFLCFTRREIADAFLENRYVISAVKAEFFIPMAVHRALGHPAFTEFSERLSGAVAATRLLGSPVLTLAEPKHP